MNFKYINRFTPEEKLLVHFLKCGTKLMNVGELKEPRLGVFNELLTLSELFKRKKTVSIKNVT